MTNVQNFQNAGFTVAQFANGFVAKKDGLNVWVRHTHGGLNNVEVVRGAGPDGVTLGSVVTGDPLGAFFKLVG